MPDVTVQFGTPQDAFPPNGEPPPNDPQVGQYKTTDEMWGEPGIPFGSCGREKGCFIKNYTTKNRTITDVHVKLLDGRKFDRNACTGGKAFPNEPKYSHGDTEVEFSGGSIPPNGQFWAKVPKSPKPGRGKGEPVFQGWLTPTAAATERAPAPPSEPKHELRSALRIAGGAAQFDRETRTFSFRVGTVASVRTGDMPALRDDDVLGCDAALQPCARQATRGREMLFAQTQLWVWRGDHDLLLVSFGAARLLVETTPGADAVLVAPLVLAERSLAARSPYLDALFTAEPGVRTWLYARGRVLEATDNLSRSGSADLVLSLVSWSTPLEGVRQGRRLQPAVRVIGEADGLSAFSRDRFVGDLIRSNLPVARALEAAEAVIAALSASGRDSITTTELRRVRSIASTNPYQAAVEALLATER